jgi:hypothetical protein
MPMSGCADGRGIPLNGVALMNVSGEETTVMVAMAEVVMLILLAAVFIWWFRRTPMYRTHRRSGVVPGQWSHMSSPTWHGVGGTLPPRPVLRPDEDTPQPSTGGHRVRGANLRSPTTQPDRAGACHYPLSASTPAHAAVCADLPMSGRLFTS